MEQKAKPIFPGDTVLVARPLPCCAAGAGSIFVVRDVLTRRFALPKAEPDGWVSLRCTWCDDEVVVGKFFVQPSVTYAVGHPSGKGIGVARQVRLEPLTESESAENFTEIYGVGAAPRAP